MLPIAHVCATLYHWRTKLGIWIRYLTQGRTEDLKITNQHWLLEELQKSLPKMCVLHYICSPITLMLTSKYFSLICKQSNPYWIWLIDSQIYSQVACFGKIMDFLSWKNSSICWCFKTAGNQPGHLQNIIKQINIRKHLKKKYKERFNVLPSNHKAWVIKVLPIIVIL